mgnify:CR=1 FL=1
MANVFTVLSGTYNAFAELSDVVIVSPLVRDPNVDSFTDALVCVAWTGIPSLIMNVIGNQP